MTALDHGTGARPNCECWRCVHHRPWPPSARKHEPKWDLAPLLEVKGVTIAEIKRVFGFGRLISWRNYGLPDDEADVAAVKLGHTTPDLIWKGWHEAAFDYYPVPDEDNEPVGG